MKSRILLIFVILGVAACRRSTIVEFPPTSTLTGTVVEYPGCGHYIVKIINGNYSDTCVEKSWTDSVTDSTFTNVFVARNFMNLQQANLAQGDTFNFTLNGPLPDSTYNTCMVIPYNLPTAFNNVTNIVKLP
jgi:hypothetical protein